MKSADEIETQKVTFNDVTQCFFFDDFFFDDVQADDEMMIVKWLLCIESDGFLGQSRVCALPVSRRVIKTAVCSRIDVLTHWNALNQQIHRLLSIDGSLDIVRSRLVSRVETSTCCTSCYFTFDESLSLRRLGSREHSPFSH